MARRSKIGRKELKKPDEFVQKGRGLLDIVVEKRRIFLPLGIAAVAVAILYYAGSWWGENRAVQAWRAYDDALKLDEEQRWPRLELDDRRRIVEHITDQIVIGKDLVEIDLAYVPVSNELVANSPRNFTGSWRRPT